MKRLIYLSLLAAFFTGNVAAQETPETILLNKKTLEKKLEKSDESIANPKKESKAATWIARAKLYQDIDNQGLEQVYLGMNTMILKSTYKEPIEAPMVDENNVEKYKYETMVYYFENGNLRGWKRVEPISEDPLGEALKCYKKAIDLTEAEKQMKLQEKSKVKLDELKEQFKRSGQNRYYHKDFDGALADFERILKVNKFEVYNGEIDTLMINYSGIVAREIGRLALEAGDKEKADKMYRKTIDYYKELAKLGSGGASGYVQMTRDFYAIGDTLGAIENLKEGLEQYPDSSLLVTVAAQAYYLIGDNKGGLEFVNKRIEEKPNGPAAYYWKGLLITNKDDVEETTIDSALALYDKSLELDPTNGNVWYQSGYVNYAVGANYFEQESMEDDDEFRQELADKATAYYEEAIRKLEKTYEITKDSDATLKKESLDLLKRIYYKLYGSDDERYISVTDRLNK